MVQLGLQISWQVRAKLVDINWTGNVNTNPKGKNANGCSILRLSVGTDSKKKEFGFETQFQL